MPIRRVAAGRITAFHPLSGFRPPKDSSLWLHYTLHPAVRTFLPRPGFDRGRGSQRYSKERPYCTMYNRFMAKHTRYLAPNEKSLEVFGVGKKYTILNVITYFPLSILLIGLPALLKTIHLWHSKLYIFTDKRVIIKDGVFSVKTMSVPYDKITHIAVKEDFLPKIFYGIGDITIHTAGAGPTPVEIDLVKVENPLKVKNRLEELIIKEKHFTPVYKSGTIIKSL